MKWRKETQAYMWAKYFSEDGRFEAWDEDVAVKSSRKEYNPETRKFENKTVYRHTWFLKDLETDKIVLTAKTLKECKEYAETH